MWNTCLRSGGAGLLVGGLGAYFVSVHGSKLEVSEESIGGNLVVISGGETDLKWKRTSEKGGEEDLLPRLQWYFVPWKDML